jgi:hypothetical protein
VSLTRLWGGLLIPSAVVSAFDIYSVNHQNLLDIKLILYFFFICNFGIYKKNTNAHPLGNRLLGGGNWYINVPK